MKGIRPFNESTKADAFAVVQELFSSTSCEKLEKYLRNPLLERDAPVGDIAYENDRPVGFQAAILRRLYLGQSSLLGVVGGMLAMKSGEKGGGPVLLMNLMKASVASRCGSVIFFANTANATSMKMNRLLGVKGAGPFTCERIRFTFTYWPRALKVLLPRPKARLLRQIEAPLFDLFWQDYLKDNRGLVTSRSAAELKWVFGNQLERGTVIFLGTFDGPRLSGYIALQARTGGKRWMIVDWIALRDDPKILRELLVSAVRHLRRDTTSVMLESVGFPAAADCLLAYGLPLKRRVKNNTFLWKFLDGRTSIPEESWFFGPFDGDRCM